MATSWTPERRAKQSAAVHLWRLWEHSTGPKTAAGKVKVSQNARKHGARSKEGIEQQRKLKALLAKFREIAGG